MKRTQLFKRIVSIWIILSIVLFLFGWVFPPHATDDRIKGAIFWWALTFFNALSVLLLYKIGIYNYYLVFVLGTILTAVTLASFVIFVIYAPELIERFLNFLSRIKFFKKNNDSDAEKNDQENSG